MIEETRLWLVMTSSAEDLLRTIREDEKRIKALREEASTIILQNATNREAIMKAIYRWDFITIGFLYALF